MNTRRFVLPLVLGAVCLLSASALARPELGPDVELFAPFSSKTRDRFGSTFTGIGLGVGSVVPKAGGKLMPDFSLIQHNRDGNRALFVIGGVQYRHTFDSQPAENARFVPYYGVSLDALYGRVKVDDEDRDGHSFGGGGSAFVGTSIGSRTFVEARVRGLSSVETYNFSGLSLSAGIRF